MRARLACMVVLLAFASVGSAQKNDSLRDTYVERFPDYFFVWPVIKQRTTSVDVRQNSGGKSLVFKPNNSYGAGFGVYLFEIGVEITFAVPVAESKNALFGTSKASDIQLNLLSRNWGADVFYSSYTGFYASDPDNPVPPNTPYPQRPDLSTLNYGLNGIYIFNKNKFSLRSAYNFAERQKKSAGSFVLAGTLGSYHLKADSALFGKNYEPVFGADADVSDLRAFTFSIAPGYTYTFVKNYFFLNGSLSIGPAYRDLEFVAKGTQQSTVGVNGFVDFRVGIGYNGSRYFGGINFVSQTRGEKFQAAQISVTSATVKFVFGYRFREFGILKKRALDLFPHKNRE